MDASISLLLSCAITLAAVLGFAFFSEACRHWFLLPVALSGIIIGLDAADWVRGRHSLMDPIGLIGLFGFHFFLLSPLLMVAWEYRMAYLPEQPDDYRPWLGGLAVLNIVGLLAYRVTRNLLRNQRHPRNTWTVNKSSFKWLLGGALVVSATAQLAIYIQSGGISGYFAMVGSLLDGQVDTYQGMGWKFCLAESFPVLAAIAITSYLPRKGWMAAAMITAGILLVTMAFGGLRGSRSNIVWPLFWAVGLIHLYIQKLSRSLFLGAIPLFGIFMQIYGFYKELGPTRLDLSHTSLNAGQLSNETGRTGALLLLSDFGRSDVQAFSLLRTTRTDSDYRFALGRTYIGALALLIPGSIWPNRPPTKVKWTTEAEYGQRTFAGLAFYSSRLYGLGGEAMLNFGPLGLPLAYALFGLLVGAASNASRILSPVDSRFLLVPFAPMLCFLVLLNDSDVLVTALLKYAVFPVAVVTFGSIKTRSFAGGRQ